ncbi:MAG: hypothetical protein GY941_12785 [Planctomycetes bacterium]|nr:hypothetical protein [Planctomycetota bacterium]
MTSLIKTSACFFNITSLCSLAMIFLFMGFLALYDRYFLKRLCWKAMSVRKKMVNISDVHIHTTDYVREIS